MKIRRLNLPRGEGKKTTHCTPAEILGRVDEILQQHSAQLYELNEEALGKIKELLTEWKHS